MARKILHGVQNAKGQPIRVTVGTARVKETIVDLERLEMIDPRGIHTDPSGRDGHTPESRAAMTEFIRKCKSGEIEMKPIEL
ncbi:hypothetical protein [Paenibacillus sp. UNC496MF]|uniref:hypothetical protein n=1 Tax=Paenibacillus sp. UNC496MF TaxID=1502753 RepID=UPI001160126F|nr:hypothetical protein [Paenibacillus sp. UNC496MF]